MKREIDQKGIKRTKGRVGEREKRRIEKIGRKK